jgi:hypothetical protein
MVESFFEAQGVPNYLLFDEKWMWFGGMACGTWRTLRPDDVADALRLARSMLKSDPKKVHMLVAALNPIIQFGRLVELDEFVLPTRMQLVVERSHAESRAQANGSNNRLVNEDVG